WIFFGDPAQHLLGAPLPGETTGPARTARPTTASSNGGPSPSQPAEPADPADRMADTVRLADTNGDGRADLWLYAGESGSYSAVLNSTNGRIALEAGIWDRGWQVVAANLNG